MIDEISATDLKRRMDAGDDIQLIDVRQPDEWAFAKIEGAKLIPLGELLNRMSELDENRETVIHCKSGMRSGNGTCRSWSARSFGGMGNLGYWFWVMGCWCFMSFHRCLNIKVQGENRQEFLDSSSATGATIR